MDRVYHSNHNIVYSCKYHIVFCPKYRRKVLVNGVDTRLKELVQSIADENRFEVIEMEIMPDHVHLLFGGRPAVWDPQGGKDHKGQDLKNTSTGISLADNKAANALDKLVFLLDGRRRATGNRQAVH